MVTISDYDRVYRHRAEHLHALPALRCPIRTPHPPHALESYRCPGRESTFTYITPTRTMRLLGRG